MAELVKRRDCSIYTIEGRGLVFDPDLLEIFVTHDNTLPTASPTPADNISSVKDPSASLITMTLRSVTRRCPRCGSGPLFRNWATLNEFCATCGFKFEREPGYWTGALIVNMTAALGAFFVTLLGGLVLTWPDVPWNLLWVGTIVIMLVVPVIFYPWSKSLWLAIELSYHSLDDDERDAATARVAASHGTDDTTPTRGASTT